MCDRCSILRPTPPHPKLPLDTDGAPSPTSSSGDVLTIGRLDRPSGPGDTTGRIPD